MSKSVPLPLFPVKPSLIPDPDIPRETSTRPDFVTPCPTSLDSIGTSQHGCPVVGWVWKAGKAFPVHCGRWDCRNCASKKGKVAWVKIRKSEAGSYQRLLTLPFRVDVTHSWQEVMVESGKVLNRFFTSLRRVFPGLRYVWVREVGGKSNMVHFHVLVNRYLPQSLLSRLWERAGAGYIVHIGLIRSAASYVCKYLVKSPDYSKEVNAALTGLRRYSSSRGLLWRISGSHAWTGARFSVVPPWLVLKQRVVAVVDGVYYYGIVRSSNQGRYT